MVLRKALTFISLVSILCTGCAMTQRRSTEFQSSYPPQRDESSFFSGLKNAASSVVRKSPAEVSVFRDANYISKDDPTSLQYKPGPLGASVYLSAAALLERKGDFAEATKQYERALQVDSKNRNALIGL